MTIRELAEAIIKETNSSSEIIEKPLPEDDPKIRQPDISRASKMLGWKPEISLQQGLQKTLEWFHQA